jgi:hypothetical protein
MRKVLAGTLLVVAFAFASAGCGGGGSPSTNSTNRNDNGEASKPAKIVLADAVKATAAANSVRINGTVSCNGQPVGLDVLISKGEGAKGALTLGGKYAAQLIVIGKDAYLHANPEFWTKFAGADGATIGNSWVKFPVTNAQFGPVVACASSPKTIFDQLKSDTADLKNNGTTTYNGQTVVVLDGGTQNGTLYVATNGIAYPVALVKKGKDGGTISFSAWNHPFPLTAPTTDVLDYSQLSG